MLTTYLKKLLLALWREGGFAPPPDRASGGPQWDIALDTNIGSCYVHSRHGLEVGAIAPQTVGPIF